MAAVRLQVVDAVVNVISTMEFAILAVHIVLELRQSVLVTNVTNVHMILIALNFALGTLVLNVAEQVIVQETQIVLADVVLVVVVIVVAVVLQLDQLLTVLSLVKDVLLANRDVLTVLATQTAQGTNHIVMLVQVYVMFASPIYIVKMTKTVLLHVTTIEHVRRGHHR